MRYFLLILLAFTMFSCLGYPEQIKPVENFKLDKYLGKWYEIARLDHSFERGLNKVTATYSLKDDGGVKVLNRGFDTEDKEWSEAEGKAYFVEEENKGYLKVSFFGPFYGSYVVFELDDNYEYAYIGSSSHDYLWFLSRTPKVSKEALEKFKKRALESGYNLDELVIVEQE